ncbi:ribosome-associated protein [Peptoniphilus olsenii]|uniref:Ribosome-associated protein n=1 Tax=Peptoniphilus olsenii TaxID=411570 RepID=A0ABV2JAE2_9FIRM
MERQIINIDTEFIKLDSLLKFAGLCDTGGMAKNVIKDELVKVNGEIETRRGRKLYPNDEVEFYGNVVVIGEK